MVLTCEMNQEDCELRLEADTELILLYLLSITIERTVIWTKLTKYKSCYDVERQKRENNIKHSFLISIFVLFSRKKSQHS